MLRTLKRLVVDGFSSMLSLPTLTRPASSAVSSSMIGAILRQGGHHGAHKSNRTGRAECSTSTAKLESVISKGCVGTVSGVLQRPQTGSRPPAIFSSGTRLFAPHAGHFIIFA